MKFYHLKSITFFSVILSLLILGESKSLSQENNFNTLDINQKISLVTDINTEDIVKSINLITVKIIQENQQTSGTLIGKKGNNYLVITNKLSMNNQNNLKIETKDGRIYQGKIVKFDNRNNNDFSLLEFNSQEEYPIAEIDTGGTENYLNFPIYTGGYSSKTGEFIVNQGTFKQRLVQPLQEGYEIGFDNEIEDGMRGGAIFWNRNYLEPDYPPEMLLIGISGKDLKNLTEYLYQDGKKTTSAEKNIIDQLNWGISINRILTQLNSEILNQYSLPRGVESQQFSSPETTNIEWLNTLKNKAKQFTVRIDIQDSQGKWSENGSGVIITKENSTYSVLTCAHVVKDEQNLTKYRIVTEDGEIYSLETINQQIGVDLAVVTFNSNQNYQLATLGDYAIQGTRYTLVAGYPQLRKTNTDFELSLGNVFEQKQEVSLSGNQQFFSNGYELAYSNFTLGGMSGGAVLDTQGRVIGIHGRAEGQNIIDQTSNEPVTIQVGYSFGIPIKTFLGLAEKMSVKTQQLIIDNSPPPQLSNKEIDDINQALLTVDVSKSNVKAYQWIERGNQLWRLNRFDEALSAFDSAIELNPDYDYIAHYLRGLILVNQSKLDKASISLREAIKKKPDFYPAILLQLLVLNQTNQQLLALALVDNSLVDESSLQPFQSANLYQIKSWILARLYRPEKAIVAATKAIEIFPSPEFYNNRGLISSYENHQSALKDYNQAIKLNPNFGMAYANRGAIYEKLGKQELALQDYNKVIELEPLSAWSYTARGKFYLNQKEYDLALADLNQSLTLDSQSLWAGITYYYRGLVYKDLEKWDEALADFNTAISLYPYLDEIYLQRGQLYLRQEHLSQFQADSQNPASSENVTSIMYQLSLAQADFQKVIDLNYDYMDSQLSQGYMLALPNLIDAYGYLGESYARQGNWQKAIDNFNWVLFLQPENKTILTSTYINRGIAYQEIGKLDLALKDFNEAISIDSNYAEAYYQRAFIYEQNQRLDLAIEDLNRAIALDANISDYYVKRGNLYFRQEENELAKQDFNQAIKINPNDSIAYYNRANVYHAQKQFELAEIDYQKAIELQSDFALAYFRLGNLYRDTSQWQLAITNYNLAIALDDDFAQAYFDRGVIYLLLQEFQLACQDFDTTIKIDANRAEAYNNRGLCYINIQEWDLALADYNQAIKIDPENENALVNRGRIYLVKQQWDLALNDFNLAIEIEPNNSLAYVNRGSFYLLQKKLDLALADYNQALEFNSESGEAYQGIGTVYIFSGEKQKARENLEKSAMIYKKQNNMTTYQQILQMLAQLDQLIQ